MATIRVDIDSSNNARQELERTRTQIISLNQQVAVNNRLAVDANAERRQTLQQINRRLRAEQGLLRVQAQRQSALLPSLREEIRATTDAVRETGRLSGVFSTLGGNIASIGIDILTRGLVDFARGSITAATRVEGFQNSLAALYGDALVANQALDDFRDLAQLPGITFEGAVEGAVRLKTVGVEGDRANAVIREFGNAAALSSASSIEMGRALVGLTQTLSRGQIEQDNLNQILENVPIIGSAIQEAFGSIDAEVIRNQLDAAGQSVQDFADILINQLSMGARASADTTANAFSNLQNATFALQAAIGERLQPAVRAGTLGITELFNATAEYISAPVSAAEATNRFNEALEGLNMTLSNTRSYEQRSQSIEAYIGLVENQIETIQTLALEEQRREGRGGATAAAEGRILDEEAVAQILELQGELEQLQGILEGSALAIDHFQGEADDLSESIRLQQQHIRGLTREQRELAISGDNTSDRYNDLSRQIIQANGVLEALRSEQVRYNSIAQIGIANAEEGTLATQLHTAAQESAAEAIKSVTTSLQANADAHAAHIRASIDTREHIELLSEAQGVLNDFWMTASGQLEDYSASIETVIPSVVNLTNEQNALAAAVEANLRILEVSTEGVESYGLALSSVAADRAIGSARGNLVNPDISDAVRSVREYTDELGNLEFAYQDVDAIQRDVISSTRNAETGFENLRGDVELAGLSLDDLETTFSRIPDEVDESTEAFMEFGREAASAIDDVAFALSPLTEQLGETGDEINSLFGAIGSALTGDIPGLIANVLDIITPGLTDPQRILEFDQPSIDNLASLQQLADTGLDLDFTGIPDFSQADPNLLRLLGLLPGAEPQRLGAPVSRTNISTFRSADDQALTEQIAEQQYGSPAYQAEVAAASAGVVEIVEEANDDIVEDTDETANELIEIQERLADRVLNVRTRLAEQLRDIETRLSRDLRDIDTALSRDLRDIDTDLARDRRDIQTDLNRDLRDIDTDYAREKRDIVTELSRDLEDIQTDLNRDLAEIQTDLNNDLRDIDIDLVREQRDIQIELAREIREIKTELSRDIIQINTDLARELAQIDLELGRDLRDIQVDLAREIRDINTDLARDIRDINQDYAREIRDIDTDLARDRRDIQTNLSRDIQDINLDLARNLEDIDTDLARDLEQINVDLARELVEINEGLRQDLRDIDIDYARETRDIDAELADERRDIATDLSRDLRDIEEERIRSIEQINTRSSQRGADIRLDASRSREDLDIQFGRQIEDLLRDQGIRSGFNVDDFADALQTGGVSGGLSQFEDFFFSLSRGSAFQDEDSRTALEDLVREFQRGSEDIALRERRDQSDLETDTAQQIAEANAEALADIAEANQASRDDLADARQESRDDQRDARQTQRDDIADANQEARDDRQESRIDARQDRIDTRFEARHDRIDARAESRQDTIDARTEARQDNQDAMQTASDDQRDARQTQRDDQRDARQESRDDKRDARQESQDDTRDARQESRDDQQDARTEARHDISDARLESQWDISDARREASDAMADARRRASDDESAARIRAALQGDDAMRDSQRDLSDAGTDRIDEIVDALLGADDSRFDVGQRADDRRFGVTQRADDRIFDVTQSADDRRSDVTQRADDRINELLLLSQRQTAEVLSPVLIQAGSDFGASVQTAGSQFSAEVEAAATSLVRQLASALSNIPSGGGGSLQVSLDNGSVFELGNILAEGVATGEFIGIPSPGE